MQSKGVKEENYGTDQGRLSCPVDCRDNFAEESKKRLKLCVMINIFPIDRADVPGVMKVIRGKEMNVRKGSSPCINFRKKGNPHPSSCKRKGSITAGADAADIWMESSSIADLPADFSEIVIF